MTRKKQYSAECKFKVVLESFQRDTTIEEVCRKFGLASSVIHRWRKEFSERGPEVFAEKRDVQVRRAAQGYEPGESPDDLKKLIGELTVQNELLKKSERHWWGNEQPAKGRGGAHAVCCRQSDQQKPAGTCAVDRSQSSVCARCASQTR